MIVPLRQGQLLADWEFLGRDLGGPWEAIRPVPDGGPESVPLWSKVRVPHCYNALDAVDPDHSYYQGAAWYRTKLRVHNPFPKGRTFLHFEGAGQKTTVFVGLSELAHHVGGYDEWEVDITNLAAGSDAELDVLVRCDNSRDLELIPSDMSDFILYGGLYRSVSLVYVPASYVDRLTVEPKRLSGGTWEVATTVRFGGAALAKFKLRFFQPGASTFFQETDWIFAGSETYRSQIELANVQLWSPDSPFLYRIEIVCQVGEATITYETCFGLRWFAIEEHGPAFLNGERLLLRGTHRHEDHAGVGAALTDDQMRSEMRLLKDMGVNFIRLGHYQNSSRFLDLCDQEGLLVWEEIPWCRGGLGGTVYQDQAKRMLINMIEQHRNHPSIIIWGLGNENDWPGDFPDFDQEAIRGLMRELNQLSHDLDSSRYTAIRRCAFCKDLVDVYSPSIWAGWYRGVYQDYRSVTEAEMASVDRMLHVEWGGDSHAGRHAENPALVLDSIAGGAGADERLGDASLVGGPARVSKDGDWSESYICDLFDWHLTEQETMPQITGAAFWVFKDFATPLRPENPVPYVNQKGVVARDGTKKESYFLFQSRWTTKPMVHIYGHSWPVRWGGVNEPKEIKVYSNCSDVELFVNGESLGRRERKPRAFPAAGLVWQAVLKAGPNVVQAVGKLGTETVSDALAFSYQPGTWGPPAAMAIQSRSLGQGRFEIGVVITDNQSQRCLDDRRPVRFSLAGDGRLLDNQGTPWGSRLVQCANGTARIYVTLDRGRAQVAVTSEGLSTVFAAIETQSN